MSRSRRDIPQDQWTLIQPCDHNIHAAVPVEVTEGGAAVHCRSRQQLSLECAVAQIHKDGVTLPRLPAGCQFLIVHYVAVGREYIFKAVVVEVKRSTTPPRPRIASLTDAGRVCHIAKVAA